MSTMMTRLALARADQTALVATTSDLRSRISAVKRRLDQLTSESSSSIERSDLSSSAKTQMHEKSSIASGSDLCGATRKLYFADTYQFSCTSIVQSVPARPEGKFAIILDQTVRFLS